MNQQSTTVSPANGTSTAHDLFVLTDEQILEIEPEGEVKVAPSTTVISSEARNPSSSRASEDQLQPKREPSVASLSRNDTLGQDAPNNVSTERGTNSTKPESLDTSHESPEPPAWLAAQMKDPWSGEEAKEFWNGVQQARSEAAAYRAAFATPEDARALKELYPGGVNEARGAANRARLLDQIDQAYFGATGGTAEQNSAARAQLAATLLREDPAAFREMVFAGLRVIEEAEKGSGASANASSLPRLAQVFAANRPDAQSAVGATLASPADRMNLTAPFRAVSSAPAEQAANQDSGLRPGAAQNPHESPVTSHESLVSAYAAFEKTANDDLERSVGTAIARTIEQALPNLKRSNVGATEGARHGVPLPDRLSAAVRQDVESALKGDRQLGEQIAQILSARRFDNETRTQVVRLIDDRARQLVPSAARRVINDWTQATLAAHRGNASRADAASSRREVEPPVAQGESASPAAFSSSAGPAGFSSRAAQTRPGAEPHRNASRSDARRLDYRKLSDEQILDL